MEECVQYTHFLYDFIRELTNIFVTTHLSITLLGSNVGLFSCLKFKNVFKMVFFSLYLCIQQQSQKLEKIEKNHIFLS